VRLHAEYRNGWRAFVIVGALVAGCSRSEPTPGKQESAAAKELAGSPGQPGVPKDVGFGTLLRDAAGVYDGKLVQTIGSLQSYLESPDALVLRLEEPGAPPDGPNLFCVLMVRPANLPVMQDRITVRGTKREKALTQCSIVSNAGR
jgi:hypothetical protein